MRWSKLIYSKRFYLSLVVLVCGLWIVNSFIPVSSCAKVWQGAVYSDACDGWGSVVDILYIVFQSLTFLLTIFLFVQTVILFKSKFGLRKKGKD